MGVGNVFVFWVIYFAPTLIAWFRNRRGKPVFGSIGQIFVLNLLLGWTVVGWILTLANAFGLNPVACIVLRIFKAAPSGPTKGLPRETASSLTNTITGSSCGGS